MFTFCLPSILLLSCIAFLPLQAEAMARSWIASANEPSTDFPIQNLPYGIFRVRGTSDRGRIGVAIGNCVLDFKGCLEADLLDDLDDEVKAALACDLLNPLMALDKGKLSTLRKKITSLLEENSPILRDRHDLQDRILLSASDVELLMPVHVGDYTDFYASIHHATHVGSIMRPDNPLMPNYKHLPIGYHGRSSSIVVSGTSIKWPSGQVLDSTGSPKWSASQALDYELEMGALIGKGNPQGTPIPLSDAESHIFGYVLLNDWSARDIQKWEYQPRGPFNGKNFATTISPWIVTSEALEPYKIPCSERAVSDPPLLDYLASPQSHTYDITVEAYLSSEEMRKANMKPVLICKGNLKDLYWTFGQMVCHHTSGGCNLRPGDLLGSGTISGTTIDSLGCLLERIAFNTGNLDLPDGTSRKYLQDGDEIVLRAYTQKDDGPRIGFGECRGIVSRP